MESSNPTPNPTPNHPSSEVWKDWFVRNGSRLLMFARQQTRTELDAEDVLQDAMVRLWKSGLVESKENGVVEPSLAAAFTQVRRAAIDQARKNIRRANREERAVEMEDASVWFDSTLEQDERAAQIEKALKTLPDFNKEVVILKIWGELTFEEIAETLDIPMNTAASRYRYALEKLRRTLTPSKLS
ncbi:MAG: sigma-70 family RNA polymerase sigma factor [Verrucomicrobiales bacterium]|nr:sigma-70 family RNA polymerase sigma factor [Verrucomicrobiales bacterium]